MKRRGQTGLEGAETGLVPKFLYAIFKIDPTSLGTYLQFCPKTGLVPSRPVWPLGFMFQADINKGITLGPKVIPFLITPKLNDY